jgi:Uma2 family endonuclease
MSTRTLMTADELLRMPDDHMRHELVEGELRTMAPAGGEHGIIAGKLFGRILRYVEERGVGFAPIAETGFKIASKPDTVLAPDACFVSWERVPASGIPKGYWPGAPDLAAEVISPDDSYREVEEKVLRWLQAGTRLVWVVNPRNRTVTVHRPGAPSERLQVADTLTGEDVLPGFACPVADLFPE